MQFNYQHFRGCGSKTVIYMLFLILSNSLLAQESFPLYSDSIPNSTGYKMQEGPQKIGNTVLGITKISVPTLTVYRPKPESANGTAIIVCPGGGYYFENVKMEGERIALKLAAEGITAFVLKYRLPSDSIMYDKGIGPLQDAQQAVKIIRMRAGQWHIDSGKIGIMGFSAGGHLAATASTHFSTPYIPDKEGVSLRPDFSILIYPLIDLSNLMVNKSAREFLLGPRPSAKKIAFFSNQLQVTPETPPAWITHAGNDTVASVQNSIDYYTALIKNGVPAEMHLYPSGGHGFILFQANDDWFKALLAWLKRNRWTK